MSRGVRRAIIVLALVGFASAATSTYVHHQLSQDPGYTSFCDINGNISCNQIYLSRFGSVGDIPVALLGAFCFGLVLMLTVAGGRGSSELGANIRGYLRHQRGEASGRVVAAVFRCRHRAGARAQPGGYGGAVTLAASVLSTQFATHIPGRGTRLA